MIAFDLHRPVRRSSAVSLGNILKNYTADNECNDGGLVQDKLIINNTTTAAGTLSLDFTTWLQTALEQFGVDSALYVRCVCSILRQPSDSTSHEDDFDDLVEDFELTGNATMLINDGNVGGQASAAMKKSSLMRDDRRTALVECLKSIDESTAVVHSFADEILLRYRIASAGDNLEEESCTKNCLNESNDSGVCASPVDTLAVNYEEEFPPLCDSFEEIKLINAVEVDPIEKATVKKASCSAEDDRRPLLRSSYPIFPPPPTTKSKFGSFSAFTYVSSSSPPQFVLPKCDRVGSGPSKLASKFDVPLWQCTCAEWFCPIHKAVELSALASRVCKNASSGEESNSGRSIDDIFDAPKFILGIICEDEDDLMKDNFSSDEVRFVQPMVAPPPATYPINNDQQITLPTTVNRQQQEQQQLIPVTPRTHFVPIRSESMEDCFQSKPFGLDEELAVAASSSVVATSNINTSMKCANDDGTQFVYRSDDKSGDSDGCCFPLTFKASNPSVALQTEPEHNYCSWKGSENCGRSSDETQFTLELAENELDDDGKLTAMIAHLQHEDDQDDDRLLQYVSNISLISPLNT